MKNTLFIAVLALSSGSLFAQQSLPTVNDNCQYLWPELLQKAMAPNWDQCQQITTIRQEWDPKLELIYTRLQKTDNEIDNLRYTEEIPAEEAGQKIKIALIKRRDTMTEAREAEKRKNQLVLGVLSAKQRQVIDQLTTLAPALRLLNEAMSAGLIPFDILYPMSSGVKGFAGDRGRAEIEMLRKQQ